MSIIVNIAGSNFPLPTMGQSPPWGDDLSDLIQALIDVSNSTTGPADILNTTFTIANNVGAASNVTGLSFSPTTVRSAIISYSLYRKTSLSEFSEAGQIMVTYKSIANTFEIAQYTVGSSEVVFSINSAGQIMYTSSNLSGTSYVGKMTFYAKSFLQ